MYYQGSKGDFIYEISNVSSHQSEFFILILIEPLNEWRAFYLFQLIK